MKLKHTFFLSIVVFSLALTAFSHGAKAATGVSTSTAALDDVTDLAVSISDTPDPVLRGENVTYSITVTNSTAFAAQNFTLRAFISNNATFASFAAPSGFNCTTPPVGETSQINCSAVSVAGSSTNIFTLVLKVDENAGIGASLYEPVNITASNDTNGGNNSAAETTDLSGGIFVSDSGGNYQRTNINTPFADNLRVRVTDGNYNPLPGVEVTFTAPTSGAGGTFTNGMTSVAILTDQNGYATAPTFTANGTAGDYIVTATAQNANSSVEFNLSNVAPMTFTVGNTNDGGAGSLRQAVEDANNNSGNDTIIFDPAVFSSPQTIILTGGEIDVEDNGSLIINGTGANKLTISGSGTSRIFSTGATLTLNDLQMSNGSADAQTGGAIISFGGILQINRCGFYNNSAEEGGGGIAAIETDLTVSQSTFFGNQSATAVGGALLVYSIEGSSTTNIINSTFNQNTAAQGGAIYKGSPIFGGDPLELNLTSVTIAGNTATNSGGGVFVEEGNFNVTNSIIAGNSAGDVNGTITSQGYNLIQSATNTTFTGGMPQTTDIIGTNPLLSPLANNGGTTETMALQMNSPAIDKGNSANLQKNADSNHQKSKNLQQNRIAGVNSPAVISDQRGVLRPIDDADIPNTGDGSDIGAFEVTAPTAANALIGGRVFNSNGGGLFNASVVLTNQNGQARTIKTNAFGYFRFEDIAAGETYIISVRHKQYQFAPKVVSVNTDLQDLDFMPLR